MEQAENRAPEPEPFDLVGKIIAWEGGKMETEEEVIEFFQHLIDTGMAWTLQGSYGRAAMDLINSGRCMAGRGGRVMRETKVEIMAGVEGIESSKVIGPNTVKYWKRGVQYIRFHHTDIITFNQDGSITLNSGGWKTMTTKARMNEYLPPEWGIVQENSIWYVVGGKGWRRPEAKDHPFADGITIHPDGTVTGAGPDPKAILRLKKKIKKYVEGFMAELIIGHIPQPGPGDCWFCSMRKEQSGDRHLLSHIEEKYYVPSLLRNAIEELPISQFARGAVGYWLKYHNTDPGEGQDGIAYTQVKKSLTRYMKRHLGMAA